MTLRGDTQAVSARIECMVLRWLPQRRQLHPVLPPTSWGMRLATFRRRRNRPPAGQVADMPPLQPLTLFQSNSICVFLLKPCFLWRDREGRGRRARIESSNMRLGGEDQTKSYRVCMHMQMNEPPDCEETNIASIHSRVLQIAPNRGI